MASKLHDTEVQVDILKTKAECDHVQFLITEKSNHGRIAPPAIEEIETLSLGKHKRDNIKVCIEITATEKPEATFTPFKSFFLESYVLAYKELLVEFLLFLA